MANTQKMSETEIYRWGAFKLDLLPRRERTTEFEQLDLKWTLEKINLVSLALKNLGETADTIADIRPEPVTPISE